MESGALDWYSNAQPTISSHFYFVQYDPDFTFEGFVFWWHMTICNICMMCLYYIYSISIIQTFVANNSI